MIGIIGFGGILGTLLRFYLGKWVLTKTGTNFPFGTWLINISGSFILGVLSALHNTNHIPDWFWLMFGIGFCGAYTTFSTFGYETTQLIENGHKAYAVAYVLSSVVLGLLFAWLGTMIVE